MAATNNKFLAPELQSSSVKGRTAARFADNRPKTITPTPFIETILPGKSGVQGFIGEADSNGNVVPEPNAYIYIYINGFLLNPPSLNPDGSFNNEKTTAIISDKNGNWKTSEFFFTVLPEFQFGQVLTFRAKAPLKQISDRTVPYAIGGVPAPIDVGVYGDNGILRPPYEGESSIMGRMSYWLGHVPPYVTISYNGIPVGPGIPTGIPILNCENRIYVYVDGVHVGTNGSVLGEVFRNEIRGTNAKFPVVNSLANKSLSLVVDDSQINIPFVDINPIDSAILIGTKDGSNGTFTFLQPSANLGIKVFKNGQRLQSGFDYSCRIIPSTKMGTVVFNLNTVVPTPSDRLEVLFQYQLGSFILEEVLSGVTDGVNDTFIMSQTPRLQTFELYRNGLHLIQGTDYTVSGTTVTMSAVQIPETGDVLLADYQPSTTTQQYSYAQTPIGTVDGINGEFLFAKPSILGNPHIFKNGLLQREGLFNDYTIVRDNVIKFTPWAVPEAGDKLLVTFYATPVLLSQVVDYLNQTSQFQENCLTASTLNINPIINYHNLNGTPESGKGVTDGVNKYFKLPTAEIPTNLRVFVNGIRQREAVGLNTGDYFIDFEKGLVAFFNPPESGSVIVGLLNYLTPDFIVGEFPKGEIDGLNVTFYLAIVPKPNTVQVFYNGVRLSPFTQFGPPDYSVVQNQITFETFTPSPGDVILVDYEIAFGSETFTSTIIPSGQITGHNGTFTYPIPEVGTATNVYKNGLLQQPEVDYSIDRGKIQFADGAITKGAGQLPQPGDIILVELNNASLFTSNPNDQLKITSPYKLDIKRYPTNKLDYIQLSLFGDAVELYPGRDDDGEFRFWFNRKTGYWKWTWYDPITGITTPFTTGQRITARAKNDSPFIYKAKR